ncbi:MAG TPA: NAD(P)/FAD-dependent oxidoreductase [Fimbriimonadaceae bacterium]|nr:NAD(P)/FAD-dependent oxidoreductase [Fimbriimonadaceae bacterium]
MPPEVVVIGAGAAGIIASWRAAQLGAKVLLLEKNPRIGTKILISGGGKCNITHDGDLEDLLHAFRPAEARFIRPACYRFTNREIVNMLTSRGLEVYTRPDGRIFPVRQTAKDVVAILASYLEEAGVEVRLSTTVKRIAHEAGRVAGVEVAEGLIPCSKVILAVGGSSYPGAGTTGDGYPWAKELGHTVVKVRAALAPIYLQIDDRWPDERAGIALRDILLKARQGKEIARWRGDLLFTHHGVSGPTVLGVSRVVAERIAEGPVTLEVDLVPDMPHEATLANLEAWIKANPRKGLAAYAERYVPERLARFVFESGKEPASQLSQKAKNRAVEAIKAWPLGQVRTIPLEKGEVVAGGVGLDEVDPHTMRSLKCKGLYLCGEILDVAGPVGGYNLQAAFATGFVAGESAAREP